MRAKTIYGNNRCWRCIYSHCCRGGRSTTMIISNSHSKICCCEVGCRVGIWKSLILLQDPRHKHTERFLRQSGSPPICTPCIFAARRNSCSRIRNQFGRFTMVTLWRICTSTIVGDSYIIFRQANLLLLLNLRQGCQSPSVWSSAANWCSSCRTVIRAEASNICTGNSGIQWMHFEIHSRWSSKCTTISICYCYIIRSGIQTCSCCGRLRWNRITDKV